MDERGNWEVVVSGGRKRRCVSGTFDLRRKRDFDALIEALKVARSLVPDPFPDSPEEPTSPPAK